MRNEINQRLYESVLAHVVNGRHDAEAYLRRIGMRFDELRAAYQSSTVTVDYGDPEVVDAYFLGYYPHYAHMASEAFDAIPCDAFSARDVPLAVTLIGGGPLPELVALVDRLVACGARRRAVSVAVIDAHGDAWAAAVARTLDICRQFAPGIGIQVTSLQADVADVLRDGAEALIPADITMIQNCLNEVMGGMAEAERDTLLGHVTRPGGYLAVSDLTRYPVVCAAVEALEAAMEQASFTPLVRFDREAGQVSSPFHRPPPRVFYGFFGATKNADGTYDLIRQPRKHLHFSTAVWQAPPSGLTGLPLS